MIAALHRQYLADNVMEHGIIFLCFVLFRFIEWESKVESLCYINDVFCHDKHKFLRLVPI